MPPSAEASVPRRRLSPTVIGLGWVSLLTDASSELIFPLLPMFLTEVLGAHATFLGVLEGLAEGTASGVKYLSGRLADRRARSKPIVLWGYGLSTLVRPLVALAMAPWHVLAVRVVDRIGKGIRSSPRDAMISGATEDDDRGRAFGFHQAMDHAGSAVGTLLGAGLLALAFDLRKVFLIASIPGFLALATLFAVPEVKAAPVPEPSKDGPAPMRLPRAFWRYQLVLFLFTAANASDAFLILKAREVGASKALAPLLWLVLHVVKASLGTLGGSLSDRLGRGRVLAAGWVVYGVCYALLGQMRSVATVFLVTAVYGLYGALTDGAEKAMVADLTPRSSRGRAFGIYNALNGIGLLVAGLIFGVLWDHAGSRLAFSVAGGQALIAAALLAWLRVRPDEHAGSPAT